MTGQVDEAGREASHGEAKPQASWETKRRCTCGEEFASGCQLAIHQASALRVENARLAGQVAAIRAKAEEWAAMCPDDDWPSNGDMSQAVIADAGRSILHTLASSPTTPEAPK